MHHVNWPLGVGLGTLGLLRPLTRILEAQLGIENTPIVPLLLTLVISGVWIAAVGFSNTSAPVLTLVVSGLTYGVLATLASGVLSPILDGEFRGPLANPIAIVPMLAINGIWGLVAGTLALGVQRLRGHRSPAAAQDR